MHASPVNEKEPLKFPHKINILIIEARFYNEINDQMIEGASDVLDRSECNYEVITVPGALELPLALKWSAQTKKFDAFIVIGCVIRGETTHYELVSENCVRGVMDVSLQYDIPVGNGVLTVENMKQALDRANKAQQNKGGAAAEAALRMLKIKQELQQDRI